MSNRINDIKGLRKENEERKETPKLDQKNKSTSQTPTSKIDEKEKVKETPSKTSKKDEKSIKTPQKDSFNPQVDRKDDKDSSLINKSNDQIRIRDNSFDSIKNKNNESLNISRSDDDIKGDKNSKSNIKYQTNISNSRIEIDANKNLSEAEKKSKIFMTEQHLIFDNKQLFTFHDLIVPAGKNAKLCLVNDPFSKILRITEIADHFKFYEPTPVIMLIGANTKNKGKLLAGISRAAFNTKSVVIDSGLQTGIEKFCIRRNIPLIGIAPESVIEYPKPAPEKFSNKMLTNGHTHFILLGNEINKFTWGEEAKFKMAFAERMTTGRKGFSYKCKGVGVIFGNIPNCLEEILQCIQRKWPLILIEDSDIAEKILEIREEKADYEGKLNKIAEYDRLIEIDDDSENLASALHLCLTVSI